MNRRLLAMAMPVVLAIPALAQQPVFRSAVDAVSVDVSVRQGNRPVTDLTALDFEILDNAEPQLITVLTYETLPIDVTLVVDLSGSVKGALLESLTRAIERIREHMRPSDRVDLVTFNLRIREVSRLQPGIPDLAAAFGEPTGPTSLFDAMTASLIRARDPDRRQMAIVFTDGADTMSFVDEGTVTAVAARVEAAVFAVTVAEGTLLYPKDPPHRKLFEKITADTGGQLAVVQRGRDLGESFVRAFDDFRTSYVLRYTFKGTRRAGWHDVGVRVTKPGRFDVRARRGYFAS